MGRPLDSRIVIDSKLNLDSLYYIITCRIVVHIAKTQYKYNMYINKFLCGESNGWIVVND